MQKQKIPHLKLKPVKKENPNLINDNNKNNIIPESKKSKLIPLKRKNIKKKKRKEEREKPMQNVVSLEKLKKLGGLKRINLEAEKKVLENERKKSPHRRLFELQLEQTKSLQIDERKNAVSPLRDLYKKLPSGDIQRKSPKNHQRKKKGERKIDSKGNNCQSSQEILPGEITPFSSIKGSNIIPFCSTENLNIKEYKQIVGSNIVPYEHKKNINPTIKLEAI